MSERNDAWPWLHVYAQTGPHADLHIVGTRAGLMAARDAIDKALSTGRDTMSDGLFAADGEGYRALVRVRSREHLAKVGEPYAARD